MNEVTQQKKTSLPPPAPMEYAGQWVAWNKDRTEVIAHAADFATVHRNALAAGHPQAIFQHVRRLNTAFIG